MRHDITCNGINALHLHGDIALNECECMVDKSTLHLVLIGWARLNGTTSNRVARLIKMIKKICTGYQQERIDPPSSAKPANYG